MMNKLKEYVFFFACKLIKRLVVATCQTVNSNSFTEVFKNYKRNVNYFNPHLLIDRQIQEKRE